MSGSHFTTPGRYDTVFIRKSTQRQDEGPQRANVEQMLRERGIRIPDDRWFDGTVSRRKVKANAEFNRLMSLVEADKVGTVYVESQDRWGTGDRPELFSLLGILREHGTRLFDLRAGKDLTEKDLATELLAFVGSIKKREGVARHCLSLAAHARQQLQGHGLVASGDAPLRLRQGVPHPRRQDPLGVAARQSLAGADLLSC
jgi:hypothetical protein